MVCFELLLLSFFAPPTSFFGVSQFFRVIRAYEDTTADHTTSSSTSIQPLTRTKATSSSSFAISAVSIAAAAGAASAAATAATATIGLSQPASSSSVCRNSTRATRSSKPSVDTGSAGDVSIDDDSGEDEDDLLDLTGGNSCATSSSTSSSSHYAGVHQNVYRIRRGRMTVVRFCALVMQALLLSSLNIINFSCPFFSVIAWRRKFSLAMCI